MDYNFPIPQYIGTNFGNNNDGAIIGTINQETPQNITYKTFSHEILYSSQSTKFTGSQTTVSWVAVEELFNNSDVFTPFVTYASAPPGISIAEVPEIYLAVREGITGFTFNVTQAGTGDFIIDAYYNTATGYQPLAVSFSPNFMKTTGLNTVTFEPPEDWIEGNIGSVTPAERWLRLIVRDTTTITVQPEITGGWEASSSITDSSGGVVNVPFFDPYKNLLPSTGDTVFLTSAYKSYGVVLTYTTGLTDGSLSYVYAREDGSLETLTPIVDTSNGGTFTNTVTFDDFQLTSTGASALIATDQAILADGSVRCKLTQVPSATQYNVSLGLSTDRTGILKYELQAHWDGAFPIYRILVYGNVAETTTQVVAINDVIEIMKYKGKVYFFVNGTNISPDTFYTDESDLLFGLVSTPTTGTVVNEFTLVDWSSRLATPLALTFATPTNFTPVSSTTSGNFQGHYFIQFLPPLDFASTTAELSPSGEAGFVIGIVSNPDSGIVTTPLQLLDENLLTLDSPNNQFFPTGTQTYLRYMTVKIDNTNEYSGDAKFLLILKNSEGTTSVLADFNALPANSNLLSTTFLSTGMKNLIIVQVDGSDVWNVGANSFISLSS